MADRTIVFLHAFPLNASMWAPQIAAVQAAGWKVIAPDVRGFGKGAPVPGTTAVTPDDIAVDAITRLEAQAIGKAVIAGLSMGGYAALALWRRRREVVRALVLADTKAGADTEEAKGNRETFAVDALEKGIGWVADEMTPKLVKTAEAATRVQSIIRENTPGAVAAAQRGMARRADSKDLLGGIDVPTLIVVGSEDKLTPPAESKAIHEAVKGSRLVEIPGAGHLANLDAPAAFNEALLKFLATMK